MREEKEENDEKKDRHFTIYYLQRELPLLIMEMRA